MISTRKEYAIGQLLKNANDLEIKGQFSKAIEEVKKAVDLNPEDGNLYNRLGDLYMKRGEKDESISNFRKGVEAFRRDNFLRNALALSKKILRYEPDGFDMYYTIADLHVELDEKQDAAQYMFEYMEKQGQLHKKKEILNAIDYLKSLELKDERFQKRIGECQAMVQKGQLEKIHAEGIIADKPTPERNRSTEAAVATTHSQTQMHAVSSGRAAELLKESEEAGALRKDIGQLDASVREVEQAVASLRESIRLDDVAATLKDSLGALSAEQRKAVQEMQQSITDNLDKIEKSVKALYGNSDRSIHELQDNLTNLNKALASLSKNQANVAQQLNSNLSNLNVNFKTLTDNSLDVIKSVQENYKRATGEMCARLDGTKDASSKLVKSTGDMKQELSEMCEALSKYFIVQESKEKKRDRYITIILVVLSVICGLFVISLIFK
jgi:tetratricopeptide (TPR) repeat protein